MNTQRVNGRFEPGDLERICDILDYDILTKQQAVLDAMERLESKSSKSVNQVLGYLSEIEFVSNNLKQEMGTKRGSLLKAGVLEWSQYPFANMIVLKKEYMTKIGHALGLQPNFAFIDHNLKIYGMEQSICRQMFRS